MGIIDILKKNMYENQENEELKEKMPLPIRYSETIEGNLQIDVNHQQTSYEKLYDSTRLIIDNKPIVLANREVYNCKVSWYKENEPVLVDQNDGEILDAEDYKEVLAQIEPERLKKDENYCTYVMKHLLDRRRVIKQLESGLQENPQNLCGNYIGGIAETDKGFEILFSPSVGKAAHFYNLTKFKEKIDETKAENRNKEQTQTTPIENEIERFQREIDLLR